MNVIIQFRIVIVAWVFLTSRLLVTVMVKRVNQLVDDKAQQATNDIIISSSYLLAI